MFLFSNVFYNGGFFKVNGFFFMMVYKNYFGDYKVDCLKFEQENGLNNFVGFMMVVNIEKVLVVLRSGSVIVYIIVGVINFVIVGEVLLFWKFGMINMVFVIEDGLMVGVMVNVIMMVIEVKIYILLRFGYNVMGMMSDGIGVFVFEGEKEWVGMVMEFGINIG